MSGTSRGIVSNFSFAQALRKLCALATAETTSTFAGLVAAIPLGILQVANRRMVNAPAAERAGGTGLSEKATVRT